MKNILEVKNLYKSYGDHSVLENINFEIKPGEIIGLIGRNGIGKTTLMKCILGLISIDKGEILFEGNRNYHQVKSCMNRIGYLLDCRLFEYMKAYDNLYIQELYNNSQESKKEISKKIEEVLEFVELKNDTKKVSEYSFGMKQRLGLALALLGDTKLLVLDEPFVGLDPLGVSKFREFINLLSQKKDVAILISSHQLSEIENMCQRYLFISDKNITKHCDTNDKTIKITVDSFTETFKVNIAALDTHILLKNNCHIIFQESAGKLNMVMSMIVQENIKIVDIDVTKSQIADLFVKEGA